jgi:hypothetical protein
VIITNMKPGDLVKYNDDSLVSNVDESMRGIIIEIISNPSDDALAVILWENSQKTPEWLKFLRVL